MVFFFFFFIIVIGAAFPYNEVARGDVSITSSNAPVHIQVRKNGKLAEIICQLGDSVKQGDVLGIMENQAEVKDIQFLKQQIILVGQDFTYIRDLRNLFPNQLNLGSTIQPYYSAFLSAYYQLGLEKILRDDDIFQEQANIEFIKQQALLQSKRTELLTTKKTLFLSQTNYERYLQLFQKGVVSRQELEKYEKTFFQEQRDFQILEQEIQSLVLNNKLLQNEQLLSKNKAYKSASLRETEFFRARQDLLNGIRQWEEEHLFTSPIDGKISFRNDWGQFQDLKKGEVVFIVVPFEKRSFIARCKLPVRNSGKLFKGQRAILRLDNFPSHEWGIIDATVAAFSQMPQNESNGGYEVYLAVHDLMTSYGKRLELDQELRGNAEIILKRTSLLQRIFYQARYLWSNFESP